jgi:hypothetical protein
VCGRNALADVVEDCALSAGRLVKRLPHVRCASCGERFFNVTAITTIEADGTSLCPKTPRVIEDPFPASYEPKNPITRSSEVFPNGKTSLTYVQIGLTILP